MCHIPFIKIYFYSTTLCSKCKLKFNISHTSLCHKLQTSQTEFKAYSDNNVEDL